MPSEGPPIRVDVRHFRSWRCRGGAVLCASFASRRRGVGDCCRIGVRCVGGDHRGRRCRDRAGVSSEASTSPSVAGGRSRATAVPREGARVSDCCASVGDSGKSCPRCGVSGSVVGAAPVRAHRRTAATGSWRYCANPVRPVVFFHHDVVDDHDVIAQVCDKAHDKPVPVCFRFAHTLADVYSDVEAHAGTSTIKTAVKTAVADGLCACEHLNPCGECCLPAV